MSGENPTVSATPDPPPPNRGGAPKGNVNAAKDPFFSRKMFEAQRLAKRDATKRLKGHLAEARRLVREAGIADSPIGERLARRLARGEHEIEMMSKIVDRVGRVRRAGELTAPYERLISLEREDRAEVRQLIDRLAELKAQATPLDAEVVYRVALADGRPLEAASTLPSGPSELSGEEGA